MSRSVLAFGVLFFVTFTIAQTKPARGRAPRKAGCALQEWRGVF